jgi:hypothetical protein
MAKRTKFTLSFAPQAIEHLDLIPSKYHGLLRRMIKDQLTHTPTEKARHRGGPSNRSRGFYDVEVLAIGVEDRSRLLIGGEEFES